ncbi:MAG: PTS system mannose/fructose/sorbose family transporter subunit IID [Endomicrobium sp.]|nr:PTS system mannose/fructose/sorbose family transporter subunit IID [Endomicrobium sp.]
MITLYTRVFIRSFFLQSLWNYERMQNIGFVFILKPFFDKIYTVQERKKGALLRHISYFNTQPYMVGIIVGEVVDMERKILKADDVNKQDEIIREMNRFKNNMAGPLAAIGDSFFYGELRPMLSFLSIFIMILLTNRHPEYVILAPIVFITLYNLIHLGTRICFMYEGFKYAGKSMKILIHFKSISNNVRFCVFILALAALSLYLDVFSFSNEGKLFNSGYDDLFVYFAVFLFSFFSASRFGALVVMFSVVTICIILPILGIK